MARVTYGPLVTELAGSIGGVTFLRNASGPISKLRTNPTVNPSPAQAFYQNNMSKLVAYWPTLSQENKDLWNTFAAAHDHTTPWGETKTLSGYQWFLSCNFIRFKAYTTPISSPPSWLIQPPPATFKLAATISFLSAEWASPYGPYTDLLFYLSLPLRQSSLKLRRSLFYISYVNSPDPISILDFTPSFQILTNVTWATFFASANCSIICRMIQGDISTGLISSFTSSIVKIG